MWAAIAAKPARLATSCSSTQPARMPNSGYGSPMGRWVGVPPVAVSVTYWPASRPKRASTRLTSDTSLRGSTPRWSPAAYDAPAGNVISRCRTERPPGLPARAVSSRLTRTVAAWPR